ncbi:MAG: hypothetical protein K6C08_02935, partial [Oscillospiraceae bacterium]|nr:hypothetical protein [Oscillospiraceae bacterium]
MMKKKLLLIFVLLCIILTGVLVYWLISLNSDKDKSFSSAIVHSIQTVSEYDCNSSDPYVSPVRFSDLRFYNPDIYAWLFIPGTDISLPLLQHSSDDSFYL